jgi:hypothetical protein
VFSAYVGKNIACGLKKNIEEQKFPKHGMNVCYMWNRNGIFAEKVTLRFLQFNGFYGSPVKKLFLLIYPRVLFYFCCLLNVVLLV